MRTFRFRGITTHGTTVYGWLVYQSSSEAVISTKLPYMRDPEFNKVIPESVCAWTQFTDKNGDDIYETDEVLYRGLPCCIAYNSWAGKCYICKDGYLYQPLNELTAADCEVVK